MEKNEEVKVLERVKILSIFSNIHTEKDRSEAMKLIAEYIKTHTPEDCGKLHDLMSMPSNAMAAAGGQLWTVYAISKMKTKKGEVTNG